MTLDDPDKVVGQPCPICGGPLINAEAHQPLSVPTGATFAGADWMRLASIIAILTAIAGFIASYNVGGGLIAGLMNPLFFIGLPLGIFWWGHSQSGFRCPHCGRRNLWSTINPRRFPAGHRVKCLSCHHSFRVPVRA
jgi:hypothetical protein